MVVTSKLIFMFEGKHIHYSPVDNKPLCSFSNKLCRQRRLNGFAFCIRHILEDKSAPFKQCTYVTRNSKQICQNAIPTSQERGYCHSHMQVAGIIPKTERKIKNPPKRTEKTENSTNGTQSVKNGDTSSSNSSSSWNGTSDLVKKDPNTVFKFEEEDNSEIQWIPKGGSINGIVNGRRLGIPQTSKHKGSQIVTIKREVEGEDESFKSNHLATPNGIDPKKFGSAKKSQNGIAGPDNPRIEDGNPQSKVQMTYSRKANKVSLPPIDVKISTNNSTTIVKKEVVEIHSDESTNLAADLAYSNPITCVPENIKFFEQFKTLKSVEKSLTSSETCFDASKSSAANVLCKIPNSQRTISTKSESQRTLNISSSSSSVDKKIPNSLSSSLSNGKYAQKVPHPLLNESSSSSSESRKEFLSQVRETFKLQYLMLKNAGVDSEKNEKIWKRALRTSLLTCVVKDSLYSAHVIVQCDSKKYSTFNCKRANTNSQQQGRNSKGKNVSQEGNGHGLNGVEGQELSNADSPGSTDSAGKPKPKRRTDTKRKVKKEVETGTIDSSIDLGGKTKKRKVNNMTGSIVGDRDTTAMFRVPKSSSSDGDLEMIKTENGHTKGHNLFSSFNGHKNNNQAQLQYLLSQPDLRSVATAGVSSRNHHQRNQGIDTILNSVGSSDMGASDGVITDASFDSTFDHHSVTSQPPDCEFSDDDLEKSLEFQIDPETEHQASRILEDNELTEDDLNELFPETNNKLGRTDLTDLDFSSAFDANDIDYTLFANIFPFSRTSQSESISISNQY